MVDLLPVALMVFGFISMVKPEWAMKVDRWINAFGKNKQPDDVELPRMMRVLTIAFGLIFFVVGLALTLRII